MINIVNAPNDMIKAELAVEFAKAIMAVMPNSFNQFKPLTVKFCTKMRTRAGFANSTKRLIQLNANLLVTRHPEELVPTFLHELGHIFARDLHGNMISAHGRQWKNIMRLMGQAPTRTHSMDTAGLERRWTRIKAQCGCKIREITKHKARKIKSGCWSYTCRLCHQKIQLVEGQTL